MGTVARDAWVRHVDALLRSLTDEPSWPDKPMPAPSTRHWTDVPRRLAERGWARARGANPPTPPWRRRAGAAWRTTIPDSGSRPGSSVQPPPEHGGPPPLMGVIAAWNEDDVIWRTVRHLYEQGCDTVFVLDDSSDDDTVAEAQAAGAIVERREPTDVWREDERGAALNRLVERVTTDHGAPLWWLVADADEFPLAPGTVAGMLRDVPDEVDVIGSHVVEHYPGPSTPAWERRSDPLAMPWLVAPYPSLYCPLGHWKHQLFRQRTPGDLTILPGAHTLRSSDARRVREWEREITMHHLPLRDLDRLARRLSGVEDGTGRYGASPDTFTRWRAHQRLELIEKLRARQWDALPSGFPGQSRRALRLTPWPGATGRSS